MKGDGNESNSGGMDKRYSFADAAPSFTLNMMANPRGSIDQYGLNNRSKSGSGGSVMTGGFSGRSQMQSQMVPLVPGS